MSIYAVWICQSWLQSLGKRLYGQGKHANQSFTLQEYISEKKKMYAVNSVSFHKFSFSAYRRIRKKIFSIPI